MAVFRCKMCGGILEFKQGETVGVCDSCGTKQTLPRLDDERRVNLYDRANHFRRNNEFDKASGIYEQILMDDKTDAEAYWSLVLCCYGIEYVEDPSTHKRVPTINRAQYTSIFDDENYKLALQYADISQKILYEEEAATINEIQKGILAISQKEDPFDIFICYKETDQNGRRTPDSVLANDLYHQLTTEGFKVFFSRITLEDKLGIAYEPYIFAALNSAKVMVVLGTKAEYFNAVWVKNEWSRYLTIVKQSGGKKVLIPAYRDMDPYDLPDEFSHLQAQDMSKLGFMQDLLRGIDKIIGNRTAFSPMNLKDGGMLIAALKRGWMAIEDGEWDQADSFFETALNYDAECANAYLGKTCVNFKVSHPEEIARYNYKNSKHFQKFVRFANEQEKELLARFETEKKIITKDFQYGKAVIIPRWDETWGIRLDGKVIFTRKDVIGEYYVPDWEDIVKIAVGPGRIIGLKADGTVVAVGENEYGECNVSDWKDIVDIYADYGYTVGVKTDRTVVAVGCYYQDVQCDVSGFTDIVDIIIDETGIIGIKADGTVVADGNYDLGKCNVSDWTDITKIAIWYGQCGHWAGLKTDGTVVEGAYEDDEEYNVSSWTDIVKIAARNPLIGLKSDGTVVAAGDNAYGECNVSDWKDIVNIFVGYRRTIGLKSDGTVVATGENAYGECNVSDWKDIVDIIADHSNTIGLKSDGTVVATGKNAYGECNVSDWKDIVSITAGGRTTIGLKSDGTVVATGDNSHGQCNVSDWKLFDTFDNFVAHRKEIEQKIELIKRKNHYKK